MNKILFMLGIILPLTGAIIMFDGSIFGNRTTGFAIVLCIVGICLITSAKNITKN